jgi:choline dehydrogenase-like flavoprotein
MDSNRQYDLIIIGAGPAGIFAALEMTHVRPDSRVLIVDTGRGIAHRSCPARINGQCAHCDPCAHRARLGRRGRVSATAS